MGLICIFRNGGIFTLVVQNENLPGMLAKITGFLGKKGFGVNMQSCYLAFENSFKRHQHEKHSLKFWTESEGEFVRSLNKILMKNYIFIMKELLDRCHEYKMSIWGHAQL